MPGRGHGEDENVVPGCSATSTSSPTSAYFQPEDADRDIEAGDYEFYTGPVRDTTAAACIRWVGSVDSVSFDSPLEHCQLRLKVCCAAAE